MSELNEALVSAWLRCTYPDNPIDERHHINSTIWEEHQLCRAWLDRAELRRSLTAAESERDALRARVAGLEAGLRRVTLALPVLRDVLRAARLAGSDVAEDMLAEARALLAPSSEETK